MIFKVVVLVLNFVFIEGLFEGEQCSKNGVYGICKDLSLCKSAMEDIEKGKIPEICSYRKLNSIVCCFGEDEDLDGQSLTLLSDNEIDPAGTCIDIPQSLTSEKTGRKAFDKCIEYQRKYVFPCERTVALMEGFDRINNCFHSAISLILGGSDAEQYEFPHMVVLGYGDDLNELHWDCGGSIISERFILTAAHCLHHTQRDIGDTIHVLVGTTKLSDSVDKSKLYKIKEVIYHPEYKRPQKYNDIGLMKTEIEIGLNRYIVPACIHIGDDVNDGQVLATGWGYTHFGGQHSDTLQKVKLTKFSNEDCSETYPPIRLLRNGYDNQTQMCYGDKKLPKDTCQGDSGGPIQIESTKIQCMYTVVGVISFGKACGLIGVPGLYTRVAPYVSWIESIVWPN